MLCTQGVCAPCAMGGAACTTNTECCSPGACSGGKCTSSSGGACSNASDNAVKASYDLQAEGIQCYSSCGGASCVADCLSGGTGLSPACAQCYGAGAECLVANCMPTCFSPTNPECVACRQKYRDAPFVTCSGWTSP